MGMGYGSPIGLNTLLYNCGIGVLVEYGGMMICYGILAKSKGLMMDPPIVPTVVLY